MHRALIVTITEGVELQPQAAFLSSALKTLGFETQLAPTDFCTTHASFQTAVRAANPDAVLFIDALEWREILATLSGFALKEIAGPVVVVSALKVDPRPAGFEDRVQFMGEGATAMLSTVLGVGSQMPPALSLPMDYGLFGGRTLLARAMGCSLFGDLGVVALLSFRPAAWVCSAVAALARLEGPVRNREAGFLAADAALAPLHEAGSAVRGVEWWSRGAPLRMMRSVRDCGVPQTIRLCNWDPVGSDADRLREYAAHGASRIVFDCDALDEPHSRVPGAQWSAAQAGKAFEAARSCGLEVGVLLVVGLPGETAVDTKARCDLLRKAGIDRVRIVPFEPTGGTPAYEWCVGRAIWPPKAECWNRELYHPLEQPEKKEWPQVLEEALMLVADVEARAGAPA